MASNPVLELEIARCRREQQEILNREDVVGMRAPAWLVMLGIEDWEMEIRLIERSCENSSNGAAKS